MRSLAALFVVTFLITFACSKKSTDPPPKPIPDGMRATIDGESWIANLTFAYRALYLDPNQQQMTGLMIVGAKITSTDTMALTIFTEEFKTGTYSTTQDNFFGTYEHYTSGLMEVYIAVAGRGSGSATISKLNDEKAEGKFSYTAMEYFHLICQLLGKLI
jgi:hypothetical protein